MVRTTRGRFGIDDLMATKIEHARLAAMLNLLRPDWPTASLQTMLDREHAARPFADLAVAAVAVAVDPTSTTPARLREAGPWWNVAHAAPTSQPPDISRVLVDPPVVGDPVAGAALVRREWAEQIGRIRAAQRASVAMGGLDVPNRYEATPESSTTVSAPPTVDGGEA